MAKREFEVTWLCDNEPVYAKRGKRYHPVATYLRHDLYPKGFVLVHTKPGIISITRSVDPDRAAFVAAAKEKEDAVREVLADAFKARPARGKEPVTPDQHAAWNALNKAFGTDMYYIEFDSIGGITDRILKVLTKL